MRSRMTRSPQRTSCGKHEAARSADARGLAQSEDAVLALDEVVERPEHEHGVEAPVLERQPARVADHRVEEWRLPGPPARLLHVQRYRVEQMDGVAAVR